jgi:hypothetical protein
VGRVPGALLWAVYVLALQAILASFRADKSGSVL